MLDYIKRYSIILQLVNFLFNFDIVECFSSASLSGSLWLLQNKRLLQVCQVTLFYNNWPTCQPVVLYSCDTMDKLRKKCESLDREIRDQLKFKEFYQFTFSFAKNPGQKGLGELLTLPASLWMNQVFCDPAGVRYLSVPQTRLCALLW